MVVLLQRLAERLPNTLRYTAATAIYGEGARLHVLAEALREVVP